MTDRINLHPLKIMMMTSPDKAKRTIIAAYRRGGFKIEGAAENLNCHVTTLIRWIKTLDLWPALDAMKARAVANGQWASTTGQSRPRGPARKSA